MCGGAFYVAREKGYFKKLNLDIETRRFDDSSAAAAAVIAGELDLALLPSDARLFNTVAKGAPLAVILDGGHNRRGFGATVINVTQALHEDGVLSVRDFARLKGKKFGVPAAGSVGHYNAALSLIKATLDPAKDVQWVMDVSQPELMRMLASNELDASRPRLPARLACAEQQMGPDHHQRRCDRSGRANLHLRRARDFLAKKRDAAVRSPWPICTRPRLNAAAIDPGPRPDIVEILARAADWRPQTSFARGAELVLYCRGRSCRSPIPSWTFRISGAESISVCWKRKSRASSSLTSTLQRTQKPGSRKEKPFGELNY